MYYRSNAIEEDLNKGFSDDQPRQMYKGNRRFEDHHIPDDEDRDCPRSVGFFYISDAADRPRILYRILLAQKLQII
jgi:hypothetical protein